jgi:hypothetical protein
LPRLLGLCSTWHRAHWQRSYAWRTLCMWRTLQMHREIF